MKSSLCFHGYSFRMLHSDRELGYQEGLWTARTAADAITEAQQILDMPRDQLLAIPTGVSRELRQMVRQGEPALVLLQLFGQLSEDNLFCIARRIFKIDDTTAHVSLLRAKDRGHVLLRGGMLTLTGAGAAVPLPAPSVLHAVPEEAPNEVKALVGALCQAEDEGRRMCILRLNALGWTYGIDTGRQGFHTIYRARHDPILAVGRFDHAFERGALDALSAHERASLLKVRADTVQRERMA